jgi:hypothetical protein
MGEGPQSKQASAPKNPAAPPRENATVVLPPAAAAGCGVSDGLKSEPISERPVNTATAARRKSASSSKHSKRQPPPDTPESEEFWREFPCHDDKYRFKFAFAEALKKASAAQLIAGAQRYATKRAGEDPRWTKLAVNWLREERWTDEPAPQQREMPFSINGGAGRPERLNAHDQNAHDNIEIMMRTVRR